MRLKLSFDALAAQLMVCVGSPSKLMQSVVRPWWQQWGITGKWLLSHRQWEEIFISREAVTRKASYTELKWLQAKWMQLGW